MNPLHDNEVLSRLAVKASHRAIQCADWPVAYVKDFRLLELGPDGSVTELKKLPQRPRLCAEDLIK